MKIITRNKTSSKTQIERHCDCACTATFAKANLQRKPDIKTTKGSKKK